VLPEHEAVEVLVVACEGGALGLEGVGGWGWGGWGAGGGWRGLAGEGARAHEGWVPPAKPLARHSVGLAAAGNSVGLAATGGRQGPAQLRTLLRASKGRP
jgi:hypothetical protein